MSACPFPLPRRPGMSSGIAPSPWATSPAGRSSPSSPCPRGPGAADPRPAVAGTSPGTPSPRPRRRSRLRSRPSRRGRPRRGSPPAATAGRRVPRGSAETPPPRRGPRPACSCVASGHRRDDGQLVAVLDRRVEVLQVADVLVVEVDVDEPPHLGAVEDAGADAGAPGFEVFQGRLHGTAADLDDSLAASVLSHRGGDLNANGHDNLPYVVGRMFSISLWNSARLGLITGGAGRCPGTASSALRPWPVRTSTTSSPRSMRPCSISLRAAATTTPPAGSVKTPSVRASSAIASTISASVASSAQPPLFWMVSTAKTPSPGSPTASDWQIVCGWRTGRGSESPALTAATMGLQPPGWAPCSEQAVAAIRSSPDSSWKAWQILHSKPPLASGTTTCRGSRQPSCSAIS